ncbi:hypothetical protein MAFF241648_21540 [Ralstonia solanacearum]|nr:hypothetical protein MAFF241648_21540 [Ralstonia solanacearum]
MTTNNKKGYTLIEVLLVTAFTFLTSAITYTIYDKATETANVQKESERLWRMSRLISNSLGAVADYKGLTNQTFIQALAPISQVAKGAPALDPDQIDPNSPYRLVNAWGTDLVLGSTANGMGFVFTEKDIPIAACAKLAPKMANLADVIIVNGITVKDATQGVQVSNLASACGLKDVAQVDLHVYKGY